MKAPFRLAAALGLPALLAAGLACGGGGGGGGGPTNPPPPPPLAFTPGGAAGTNSFSLAQGAATNSTTLVLELRANEVSDVYGLAFDLAYPRGPLTFTRATEGPFLGAPAAATSFNVAEASPGSLVVGVSRLGQQAGASGSGLVLTLEFSAGSNGTGNVTFSQNVAFSPDGAPKTGVAWTGGSVQVNR